jgi:hypothetical protein
MSFSGRLKNVDRFRPAEIGVETRCDSASQLTSLLPSLAQFAGTRDSAIEGHGLEPIFFEHQG